MHVDVPEGLATCADLPKIAPGQLTSQKAAAKQFTRAEFVIHDCKGNLQTTFDIIHAHNELVDQANAPKKGATQ